MIVCTDSHYGIGMNDGSIPFKFKKDREFFYKMTKNQIVIMGRKTFEAIGHPLPDRINVVLTQKSLSIPFPPMNDNTSLLFYSSLADCLEGISSYHLDKFIIGGSELYNQCLKAEIIMTLYHTIVPGNYECDVKMMKYNVKKYLLSKTIHWDEGKCYIYNYKGEEEEQVLQQIHNIYEFGNDRIDRTQIGARSLFGGFFTFNLQNDRFPLSTSKRVPFRHIFEELMWFLKGDTNVKHLEEKDIYIWTPNTKREFLDSNGHDYLKEGDVGPTYGFLFRHYGANYTSCDEDYTGQGVDQIQYVINLIKNNPSSRRIIIQLWDPSSQHKCALPPCLYNYQFYVEEIHGVKYLSCLMTQRSSDISLAGFWNIATGSLLTYLLARITGCKPKTLHWNIGDMHIYHNQFEMVKELLRRTPRTFPLLLFHPQAPSYDNNQNITDFQYEHLRLVAYWPSPSIKPVFNA